MTKYKAVVHFMVEVDVEANDEMEAYELMKQKDVQVEATLNGVKQSVDFNCIGEIWEVDEEAEEKDLAWVLASHIAANGTEEQIEAYIQAKENK